MTAPPDVPAAALPAGRAPALADEPELLDRPGLGLAERRRALADLSRVNGWLLGARPVLRALMPRILRSGGRQRLLDVGAGTGEISAAVGRRAARRGVELACVAVDRQLGHLTIGRELGACRLGVVADAGALPFRDGAFDWTLSNLFFHHGDAAEKLRVLDEMERTTRRGTVVVDLVRSRMTIFLARWLLPLAGLGKIALHDGVLSAERSSTLAEVGALVADRPVEELRRRFPCRFSLVLARPSHPESAAVP